MPRASGSIKDDAPSRSAANRSGEATCVATIPRSKRCMFVGGVWKADDVPMGESIPPWTGVPSTAAVHKPHHSFLTPHRQAHCNAVIHSHKWCFSLSSTDSYIHVLPHTSLFVSSMADAAVPHSPGPAPEKPKCPVPSSMPVQPTVVNVLSAQRDLLVALTSVPLSVDATFAILRAYRAISCPQGLSMLPDALVTVRGPLCKHATAKNVLLAGGTYCDACSDWEARQSYSGTGTLPRRWIYPVGLDLHRAWREELAKSVRS